MMQTQREAVLGVVEWVNELHDLTNYRPAENSQAALELSREIDLAGEWSSSPVADAYSTANLQLAAAGDLLLGVEATLSYAGIAISPFVLARASLEAAARAWWMLDPAIDHRQRAARAATERLHTLQEKGKFPTELVNPAQLKFQMDRLLNGVAAVGMTIIRDKRDRPLGIEQPRPQATALAQEVLQAAAPKSADDVGGHLYRWYCAVTHSSLLGLVNLFRLTDSDATQRRGVFSLSPDAVSVALGFGLLSYSEACERELTLYGWDMREFRRRRMAALAVARHAFGANDHS